MGLKSDDKCLAKAADDEPLFVLRAQDRLAPSIVRHWVQLAMLMSNDGYPGMNPSDPKIVEALDLADAMEAWQEKTGRAKFPD